MDSFKNKFWQGQVQTHGKNYLVTLINIWMPLWQHWVGIHNDQGRQKTDEYFNIGSLTVSLTPCYYIQNKNKNKTSNIHLKCQADQTAIILKFFSFIFLSKNWSEICVNRWTLSTTDANLDHSTSRCWIKTIFYIQKH